MDIMECKKESEITNVSMEVLKDGEVFIVDVTISVDHISMEVEEEIVAITDDGDRLRSMTTFTDGEQREIFEAAKFTF